jgi:hypothetical protein
MSDNNEIQMPTIEFILRGREVPTIEFILRGREKDVLETVVEQLVIPKNVPYDLIMLTEKEFCKVTGQTLATARSNRIKGKGCHFYKIGGAVRYKLSEVVEFIEGCKCTSTTKPI